MNRLAKSLLVGLLEQESNIIALYGGGFKPPTKGHFSVVKKTLQDYPEITKFYVVVGSGLRNNISQDESYSIWNMYKKYLGNKVEIVKAQSPLQYIKDYLQDHAEDKVYAVVGTREGSDDDIDDFNKRKAFFEKYGGNVEVLNIITSGGISGTKAREAAKISQEEFSKYLPDELPGDERDIVWDYVKSVVKENLDTPLSFDYLPHVKSLTKHMVLHGLNLHPLPKIKFIHDDHKNAENFFGKTAYYDPNQKLIVLYTCKRHPKDVMRSFAHEMIHHMQNLDGRLANIATQNTNEEGDLPEVEREAYEKGNMLFRGWTDTLTEGILKEGRYDKISNKISSEIFNSWKQDFSPNLSELEYENVYNLEGTEFEIYATLTLTPNSESYKIDGGLEETEDGYAIYIDFSADPDLFPNLWSEISMNLKDVIRHEIEHITQSNIEQFPSKYMKDDRLIRDLINAELLSPSQYFKLEKEIDAQLQGMYFRAKKEKKPFKDILDNYLDLQDITPEEKEEILNIWRKRIPALSLPKF